jgi:hypothetical protein
MSWGLSWQSYRAVHENGHEHQGLSRHPGLAAVGEARQGLNWIRLYTIYRVRLCGCLCVFV